MAGLKAIDSLLTLGLSRNEAKIYVSMARLGLGTISQIASSSGVRREIVYRSLEKMEKAGYVNRQFGTPLQFRAVESSEIGTRLLKELSTRNAATVRSIGMLRELGKDNHKNDMGDNFMWTCNREAITDICKHFFIDSAKHNIDLVFSRKKMSKYLLIHKESIKKALSRGVHTRYITERGRCGISIIEDLLSGFLSESTELRYVDTPISHFGITDDSYLSISTSTEGDFASKPVITTFNKPVIAVYRIAFDQLWEKSVGCLL